MHVVETFVDFRKYAVVSDILVDLELALQVIWMIYYGWVPRIERTRNRFTFDETRQLSSTLHSSKGSSPPCAASDLGFVRKLTDQVCQLDHYKLEPLQITINIGKLHRTCGHLRTR